MNLRFAIQFQTLHDFLSSVYTTYRCYDIWSQSPIICRRREFYFYATLYKILPGVQRSPWWSWRVLFPRWLRQLSRRMTPTIQICLIFLAGLLNEFYNTIRRCSRCLHVFISFGNDFFVGNMQARLQLSGCARIYLSSSVFALLVHLSACNCRIFLQVEEVIFSFPACIQISCQSS